MAVNVQVILREDVPKLGKTGEIVRVRRGFARNYLVPQALGVLATRGNVRQVEHEKVSALARASKLRKDAETRRTEIEGLSIEVSKQAGEEGKLFGSVTTKEIAELLETHGQKVDRRTILLDSPIRELGDHEIKIKLAPDVLANFKIRVVEQRAQ
ncbi:MAG: 50S ribosomal protein L9 [Myxococcales bacterium]|nr:MAG: 50S ribosomal protein L9 [Myxococcales bacterium]